jgi:hypothetical protein
MQSIPTVCIGLHGPCAIQKLPEFTEFLILIEVGATNYNDTKL